MLALFVTEMLKVVVIGLIAGAGLPALFALGMASWAYGTGGDAETTHAAGHPLGKLAGLLCFVVVLAAIALGIAIVVASGFGYEVSFEHVLPTFVPK